MMGPRQEAQAALFYEFSPEDHVPQDHLLRSIDRFVDLSDIRQYLAEFYSHTGRPSIDPELLIRMPLLGYCFGIRSERRLCEEVHLNLAYRWFCGLDLPDPIPNHSTFSKNRHGRFRESALLRHLFEKTVARCIADGLVSGQRLAADASLIEGETEKKLIWGINFRSNANKQNSTSKADWYHSAIDPSEAPRAVREYLEVLDDAAFGAASEVEPKFTAPSSQWTAARKGPAFRCSIKQGAPTAHGLAFAIVARTNGATRLIFEWDAANNQYICPEGEALKQFRRNYSDPNRGPGGKGVAKTEQYFISMRLRKKVEMLFAHLKRILGLGRLRLRGPCGANDEFLLAAAAQNLRKLAKILPAPQQTCKA